MTISADELAEIDDLIGGPPSAEVEETATATDLALWLGLTANRVNTLSRDGVFARATSGRFPLRKSIRAYCEHLRQTSSSRGSADPAYVAAKTRAAEATAEKIEAANARARGQLLDSADVEKAWAGILRDVRAGVLAAPSRIGSRLPHLTAHDVAEISRELSAALSALAEGTDHAAD